MLEVKNLNAAYGKVHVLHDVSLHVKEQEIVSIIGANGAGKSTLMRNIMGFTIPDPERSFFTGKTCPG